MENERFIVVTWFSLTGVSKDTPRSKPIKPV
jgi:hypothetical protein